MCALCSALISTRTRLKNVTWSTTETLQAIIITQPLQRKLRTGSICPHTPCGIQSNDSEKERQKCCEQTNTFINYTFFNKKVRIWVSPQFLKFYP